MIDEAIMIQVLHHQRITRRPVSTALGKQQKTSGNPNRMTPAALIKAAPVLERLLVGTLLLGIIILLLIRLLVFGERESNFPLPRSSEAEQILFHYIVPKEMREGGKQALNQQLIEALSLSSHTVMRGDTLSKIAQKFGLNLDTIISYNNIRDVRALQEGVVLLLPNTNGLKYRVKRGDYLGGIARKYSVPLNELLDWNRLTSSVILPGQELFIPGARLSEHELNKVLGKLFIYPTRGRITSRYGNRLDPFTRVRRFHNGVDLANKVGTPILAAMSGKVAKLGFNPNYGKYLILTHADGFQTLYAHLDSFLAQTGARVKQGQLIARMGNSGYSTGSHLHFSIFQRGEHVDPLRFLH